MRGIFMGAINVADILTMQDLANGHLDVKALGEAANGDENTIVTTRTGNTYPSAERAINIMFQNGGLPATPFPTKVKMETEGASLADGQLAMVTDDRLVIDGVVGKNNGLYVKTAGSWVKSGYDPLGQSSAYTDDKLDALVETDVQENLQLFVDKDDAVYAYFDSEGYLRVTNLDDSVQGALSTIKNSPAMEGVQSSSSSDLYQFLDNTGALIAKFDESGGLHLVGLDGIVQDYLLNVTTQTGENTSPKSYKTTANLFSDKVAATLNQVGDYAPIGEGMLQQQYHLGSDWVSNLSVSPAASNITIGAFNDNGTATNWVADSGVVHPDIADFGKPVCGYRYWMGVNPYTSTNENFELPYIYGSNSASLDNWTLIPDFPQPFDVDPENINGVLSGHLSDSSFTYDPINGELWFFWRQTRYYDANRDRNQATNTFVGRSTKDGTTWSEIKNVLPTYTIKDNLMLSPAINYNANDGLFYMYYINLNGSMSYMTSDSIDKGVWGNKVTINLPFKAWHLDIKWCGDALVALAHSDTVDQLYVGISYDMKSWRWGESGLFNSTVNLYKSTFLPVFNDSNEISLKIIYTSDQSSTPSWRLFTAQTNFTSIKDTK